MNGTRKDNPDSLIPNAGEYGKDANGEWFGWTPNNHGANLSRHEVVEHSDGTISVAPSILVSGGPDGRELWHGYLTNGVWREC